MAYTVLANFNWGTGPKIPVKFEYDRKRNGTSMQYRIKTTIGTISSSSHFGYRISESIVLNGTKVVDSYQIKGNSPSQWSAAYVYETGWFTVANKTSGTTSLKITLETNAPRGNASYSYSLTVDPGKSTMTVPTFTIGTAGNFSIARNNSSFTHTITYKFGSASGTITTKTTNTTVSWTPPLSLYLQIIGKSTAAGTVTLETFSGTTSLGTNSYTLNINGAGTYTLPSASNLAYIRGQLEGGEWTDDENGSDVKLTFDISATAISGIDTTIVAKIDDTAIFADTAVSGEKTLYAENIGTDSTLKFQIFLYDNVSTAVRKFELTIPTLEVLMNKNFDLLSVCFGGVAEEPRTVKVAENWRFVSGKTLFNDAQTNGAITLNESASNFRFIEIFYKDNDGRCNSVKISAPFPALAELTIMFPRADGTVTIKSRGIKISGTQITTVDSDNNYSVEISGVGSTGNAYTINHIYIYKVIGIR